jgi:hypothetical protein
MASVVDDAATLRQELAKKTRELAAKQAELDSLQASRWNHKPT